MSTQNVLAFINQCIADAAIIVGTLCLCIAVVAVWEHRVDLALINTACVAFNAVLVFRIRRARPLAGTDT
jgi:hypothetical protein